MLKSEPLLAVRCPSCGTTLEGDFGEAPVNIDDGEMLVSLCCEGCGGRVSITVGPILPDGRRVEVDIDVGV